MPDVGLRCLLLAAHLVGLGAQRPLAAATACLHGRMLPTAFLVGAQKCGTTSLNADMLRHVPGLVPASRALGTSSKKELHFFDIAYERGLQAYARSFPVCTAARTERRTAIDATPRYLRNPSVADRIHEAYPPHLLPQLRFIMILRDPTERVRSWYDHFGARYDAGQAVNAWVVSALSAQARCARRHSVDITSGALWGSQCRIVGAYGDTLSGGLYAPQLQKYIDRFTARQVAVVSFQGYVGQTRRVLTQLGRFLSLQLSSSSSTRRRLQGGGGAQNRRPRSTPQNASDDSAEWPAGRALLEAEHKNTHKKHRLNTSVRQHLDAFYRPHVAEFGKLLLQQAKAFRGDLLVLPRDLVPKAASPLDIGRTFLA